MVAVMWTNALLLGGSVLTLGASLGISLHGLSRILEKLRNARYEKQIQDLEKQRSLLKFSMIPKKEHTQLLFEARGECDLLQERVATLIERQKEMNTRLYELTRENKHLAGTEQTHREIVEKLARIKEDYEDVLEHAHSYHEILSEYLDPVSVDVLLTLVDAHPYTLTTQDVADIVESTPERVFESCKTLLQQKWVLQTKNKKDVFGAQWRVNPKRRENLFARAKENV
ncbi:hypothetical protein COT72_00120 [archaeon CG10_big_fil_rev_8_21_14_0_10_43_11]|nr:MAG: hypothetical protein COT72_00120 [archaeon CG10_big_fil_rev_8_21_14_0_10_43_11]